MYEISFMWKSLQSFICGIVVGSNRNWIEGRALIRSSWHGQKLSALSSLPRRNFVHKKYTFNYWAIFYRSQISLGSILWVRMSVTENNHLVRLNWCDSGWWRYQLNLLTDNTTFQCGNAVTQSGGQILNQHKLYRLVAQFAADASGASWWPKFANIGWNVLFAVCSFLFWWRITLKPPKPTL